MTPRCFLSAAVLLLIFAIATGPVRASTLFPASGQTIPTGSSLLKMAKAYETNGDYPTAIFLYNEFLTAHPSNTRVSKMLVHCYDVMMQKETPPEAVPVAPVRANVLGPQLPDISEAG